METLTQPVDPQFNEERALPVAAPHKTSQPKLTVLKATPPDSPTPRRKAKRNGNMGIIGVSPLTEQLRRQVKVVAPLELPVLITGDTGTGKELISKAIHQNSHRRNASLTVLNCGTLDHTLYQDALFGHQRGAFTGANNQHMGIFEQANGGTLFLDEVGEMPLGAQAALLRVLETGEITRLGAAFSTQVNFRLVTATNRDLIHEAAAERFRLDLYHRISTLVINTPPLHNRTEDIKPLANHFLEQGAVHFGEKQIDDCAMSRLCRHRFTGNVRELRNLIFRGAVNTPDQIITETAIFGAESPKNVSPRITAMQILDAFSRHDGNISAAARALNIPRSTLRHRLNKLKNRLSADYQ